MASRQILHNGKLEDVEAVQVVSSSEPWANYLLEDGTTIKLRVMVVNVWRFKSLKDPNGGPLFNVASQNVMHVDVPPVRQDLSSEA